MNTKVLLAALAAGVAFFLLGWLVYGVLLDSYFQANTTAEAQGVMKKMENMNMMGMIISNLAAGALVAWSLSRMGVTNAMGGLFPAAVIGCLIAINFDMFMYSMTNWYSSKMIVIVDVLITTVFYGVVGGIAGWVLGMGRKAAA
ncbi:MAG: hypothetical protein WAU70_10515 [Flavobacteriales bacterium]